MSKAGHLGIVGLLALTPSTRAAATEPVPRTISTTGEAEVRVVPDEVILTLGVETSDKDMDVAKKDNDARVSRVLAIARDLGIDRRLVRTDYLGIEPRYQDEYRAARSFLGYWVRKTVAITLNDVTKFEDLLSRCLAAGVTHVQGVNFRTTELRKYRDQARSMAIKAARQKAIDLAGELGQKVGKPRSIGEGYGGWYSGYGSWWGGRWGNYAAQNVQTSVTAGPGVSEDGSLPLGQISVNASVNVTFELE